MVKDIARGINDLELTRKYGLSNDQLRSVFKQLAGLRERRIQMLVEDLKSGIARVELMEKYHFTAEGFQSALRLLLDRRLPDGSTSIKCLESPFGLP